MCVVDLIAHYVRHCNWNNLARWEEEKYAGTSRAKTVKHVGTSFYADDGQQTYDDLKNAYPAVVNDRTFSRVISQLKTTSMKKVPKTRVSAAAMHQKLEVEFESLEPPVKWWITTTRAAMRKLLLKEASGDTDVEMEEDNKVAIHGGVGGQWTNHSFHMLDLFTEELAVHLDEAEQAFTAVHMQIPSLFEGNSMLEERMKSLMATLKEVSTSQHLTVKVNIYVIHIFLNCRK